jgi:hypothetical protein
MKNFLPNNLPSNSAASRGSILSRCLDRLLAPILGLALFTGISHAAAEKPNYDESKVAPYTLPDPLTLLDGTRVTDAKTWQERRRPEILELFRKYVYGRSPGLSAATRFETRSVATDALGGKAMRKQIRVYLTDQPHGPKMDILLYVPNAAKKPVPVFVGLNFYGNQCVDLDPGIEMSQQWMRPSPQFGIVNNRATAASRGCQANCWQIGLILSRGYGLATAYYGDIEPDSDENWKTGVRTALSPQGADTVFKADDWGAIGAWAWGLSRIMDYLETDRDVDAGHVAVTGHSRLGKTALWAGAQDQRFALVISTESGAGGAKIRRRNFGESDAAPSKRWYCANYIQFDDRVDQLPVDQHELIALIAPRPVYVASAEQDLWADPRGEFLGALGADPVYRLLGTDGLGAKEMPPLEQPVTGTIGYHIRRGPHNVMECDWRRYLDFADRHWKR